MSFIDEIQDTSPEFTRQQVENLPEKYEARLPTIPIHTLLEQALDKGVDVLERVLALQERLQAKAALDAYTRDMLSFQEECPPIPKTKTRYNNGQPVAKYAPIDVIVRVVRPLAAAKGFTYRFDTIYTEREVHVRCIVRHIGGHTETTEVPVPELDTNKMMNTTQARMGTITMAKREALCNAFGLAATDEDTNGYVPASQYASPEQVVELTALLEKNGVDIHDVYTQAKVNSLEELSLRYAQRLIDYFKEEK